MVRLVVIRKDAAVATSLGRNDVYRAALRQLCRIEGREINDPLASEFAVVMRALEEALSAEAGKTKRLNRTRQKLDRVGVRQTLADLALKPQPSMGFIKLVEFGMADMSAEALILKYRNEFEPDVVEAATKRLRDHGITLDTSAWMPQRRMARPRPELRPRKRPKAPGNARQPT